MKAEKRSDPDYLARAALGEADPGRVSGGSAEWKLYLTPYDPASMPLFCFSQELPMHTWTAAHAHDWAELLYTGSGSIVVCTDRGNWLAPENNAVWIPPATIHRWFVPRHSRSSTLWLNPGPFLDHCNRFSKPHVVDMPPILRQLLFYLSEADKSGEDHYRRLTELLQDFLLMLQESSHPLPMPTEPRLVELCSEIAAYPGNALTRSEWARRIGMSERNLARLFRRETGLSFHAWRQTQRMGNACKRLMNGESITCVALECGYSSPSAFTAAFRQNFGCSPRQYIQEQRKNPCVK